MGLLGIEVLSSKLVRAPSKLGVVEGTVDEV
jgi:hypothetical protein